MLLKSPDDHIPIVDTENEDSVNEVMSIMGMPLVGTLNEKIQTFRNMGFEER